MRHHATRFSRMRAYEALESLLARSSAIRVNDVSLGVKGAECEIDIVAKIDVLGSSHTLACRATASGEARSVRRELKRLRKEVSLLPGEVTPILAVPYLSAKARALCRESNTGFVDLEGNGSVGFGEVFVSARALPCSGSGQSATAHAKGAREESGGEGREACRRLVWGGRFEGSGQGVRMRFGRGA